MLASRGQRTKSWAVEERKMDEIKNKMLDEMEGRVTQQNVSLSAFADLRMNSLFLDFSSSNMTVLFSFLFSLPARFFCPDYDGLSTSFAFSRILYIYVVVKNNSSGDGKAKG